MCKEKLRHDELYICNTCLDYLEKNKTLKNIGDYYYLYYYNEKIRRVLSNYKLKNRRGVGKKISEIISSDLKSFIKNKEIEIVIPVPINIERFRERGFNQIEEILNYCEIPYVQIERVKDTEHMYELKTQEERYINIKNAFKINKDLRGKKILIIDDILTTGATVGEIVEEIRKSCGIQDIIVFSLTVAQSFLKRGEKWD